MTSSQSVNPASAEANYRAGMAALSAHEGPRDPRKAWQLLEQASSNGHVEAPALMAMMCLNHEAGGETDSQDVDRAVSLYRLAAERGSPEACYRLGTLHSLGWGVPEDAREAFAWLERAARGGHPDGLMEAVHCLDAGRGTAADPERALRGLQMAVSGDLPRAWMTLGAWLYDGHNLPPDAALAHTCFKHAAARDYPLAGAVLESLGDRASGDPGAIMRLAATDHDTRPRRVDTRIHEDPLIQVSENVLPLEIRAHLIDRARPRIHRSGVLKDSKVRISEIRTSGEMCFVAPFMDPTVRRVEDDLHALAGYPRENGEPLIVLHYIPGTEYKPHWDYFDPARPGQRPGLEMGGQRLLTLLTYLSPVDEGGGTAFPELDLEVRPQPGATLLFANTKPDGDIEPRSLHAGLPVVRGEKWLVTRWIRSGRFTPVETITEQPPAEDPAS